LDQETVKIVAGVLCLLVIGVIILRRRNKKKNRPDDF